MTVLKPALAGRMIGVALAASVVTLSATTLSAGAKDVTELSIAGAQQKKSEIDAPASGYTSQAKGVCKAGFYLGGPQLAPYNDGPDYLVPAAVVKVKKPCRGAVLVNFNSEVRAPGETDRLTLSLIARCKKPAGYSGGCEKGHYQFAQPSGYGMGFVSGPIPSSTTQSMQWILPDLPPGLWKFEVMAYSGDSENVLLNGRSLSVQAFEGG